MLDKIRTIITNYKDVEQSTITEQSSFAELGIDSLDIVEMIMELEDEFGVSIEMSPDIKTVGDLMDIIKESE